MITPTEQKQLKQIIGAHYADGVLELLINKAIRNKNGHPHNAEYVRMVFQGYRNNEDVEAAIWTLAANKKEEAQQLNKQKQQILNAS